MRFSLHLSIGVCLLLAFHALVAWKTERSVIPYLNDPLDIFFFGMFAAAGVLALGVAAVRALTPEPYKEAASVTLTTLCALAAATLWWIGIERNAGELERGRERMIDVLAKGSDA